MAKTKRDIQETPIELARRHYNIWLEAELTIAEGGQSYTIGTRTLTRANLAEIRKMLGYWEDKIAQLEMKGRNRIYRAVPRDL